MNCNILMLVRNFASTILVLISLFFISSCKLNQDVLLMFKLNGEFERMEVEILNTATNESTFIDSKNDFDHVMQNVERDEYLVKMAAFYKNSDDTASYLEQRFSVGYEGYTGMFNFFDPDEIVLKNRGYGFDTNTVTVNWNTNESFPSRVDVYVSDDSTSVFNQENIVASDVDSLQLKLSGKDVFVAIKRSTTVNTYSSGYVKSKIYKVNFDRKFNFYINPDEWVDLEMNDYESRYFKAVVTPGQWYVFEAYDGTNSEQTGLGFWCNYGQYVTRRQDGHMLFYKFDSEVFEFEVKIGYPAEFGTFRFRLRSINPSNVQTIEGEHEFTENSQILYAERYFDAGTYTIKTWQNDLLSEAYVYWSMLQNNQFLSMTENSFTGYTSNLGPNFRDDTTTQVNQVTFPESGMVQMIMISSYDQTPGSFFVEIE